MIKDNFGVITFPNTHFAIQAEDVMKDKNIFYRTIPTPREITRSCGLSIIFQLEDMDKVVNLFNTKALEALNVYKLVKEDGINKIEKIV